MLIQNISNSAQATQPSRHANDRLASDGVPIVVATTPITDSAPVEFKQIVTKSATEPPSASPLPSAAPLQSVVDSINRSLKQANKNLEFSVDPDTKKSVIRLVDTETGDLIRQFPSAEALKISLSIDSIQQGLLLRQKA